MPITKRVRNSSSSAPQNQIEIKHTQDLVALIANGTITPTSPLPPEIDRPSTRTIIRSIHASVYKARSEPYQFSLADGLRVKTTFLDPNLDPFAPPPSQLPGPKKIEKWIEEGKFYLAPCPCGAKTLVIQVTIISQAGVKVGFYSLEDGKTRLDNLTEEDFISGRERPNRFSWKEEQAK